MSSRQIRKLQKQKDLEKAQESLAQDSDESDGYERPVAAAPRMSLFAALNDDEDDDDQDEAQDDDQNDIEAEAEPQPVKKEVEDSKPASGKSSKKKKKKKKKAAKAAPVAEADANDDEEDEIDRAMKELNISTNTKTNANANDGSPSATDSVAHTFATRRRNELLSINTYHLKAMNEMRALFGHEVIESASAEQEQEARDRQRRGVVERQVDLETFLRGRPGQPKLPEVSLRRNIFIQGREHWPRHSVLGLTMKEIKKAEDGSWTEYAYLHEGEYDAIQSLFFTLVNVADPMRMVHLLLRAPYHVSTLLQVSSVAKQDQNMALAAELCERALFSFGRVTSSAFKQNLEQGRARLDFRRPENRQFWLAGYHYLKSLIRKGTYRTALEWSKLLYALDTQDPYAMRHFIHVLAIRAHESKWLVDFLEEVGAPSDEPDSIYLRQSLVLARLQMGEQDAARVLLEEGMKKLPWLYCALFQELNLDTPPSIWGINADSDERSFWVKLYIYQAKDLWNNTQAISLLQSVAKALSKVDTSSLPAGDERPGLSAARLVFLEGQTSIITHAPREYLERQPNYEFDPLPPTAEENIFTGYGTQAPFLKNGEESSLPSANEARLRDVFARLMPAPVEGVIAGPQDADENDEAALQELLGDEELRRDIEEQVRGGNGNGVLATLMQMFGARFGGQAEGNDNGDEGDDEDVPVQNERADQLQDLPGAWPSDDEDEHGGHR
ncbi:transcriptional repressor TCF25-domain-containing protein [Mariannaea sp. PMI_226]|nr:transcriptional repressor TCF25-domain-containing protein [Mariannaea sp. PMI_226]